MLSYQDMINSEYLNRQAKNPAYSMRGYARDLGLSQSFLSQVLSSKRKLSDETGLLISEKLKLRGTRKSLFSSLIRLEKISSPDGKRILEAEIQKLLQRQTQFKPLAEDVFNAIADWHYFAILELTLLENFQSDIFWIAKKLKMPAGEVKAAVERLKRLGVLTVKNGNLVKMDTDYIYENVPSAAIKKHHRDTLLLAQKALTEQNLDEREFFTVIFPMDFKKITEAKTRIREFSAAMMSDLQKSQPKSIYKLAVQFFRVDDKGVL